MKFIFPFSSEITIAIASVFSVIPNAALCLSPKREFIFLFSETGRITLAAVIKFPSIITAPSCRGLFLKNIL